MIDVTTHKHCLNEKLFFEKADPEFLDFVIKYLSEDTENWKDEWVYEGMYPDESQCVCGKENIATVYIVRNVQTNTILSPIGSVCINLFSKDVIKEAEDELKNNLLKIFLKPNKYNQSRIAMSSKFFKKENIESLFDAGVITEDEKDKCLKALNKRTATVRDFYTANVILMKKIIPALEKSLKKSIKNASAEVNDVYFDMETRRAFEKLFREYKQKQKQKLEDIQELMEDVFEEENFDVNSFDDDEVFENIKRTKTKIYNELKYLDSYHKNFYEARLLEKSSNRYLLLEDHLTKDLNSPCGYGYESLPTEVKVFKVEPEIEYIDDILCSDDFENDFEQLPEPDFSVLVCSEKDLIELLKSL